MAVNLIDSNDIEVSQTGSDIQLNLKNPIESGSNDNGSYIKFGDGTMICYGNREPSLTINTAWGNLYRSGTFNIAYPVNFYNEPSFNIMMRGGTSAFILNWNAASDFKTSTGDYVVVRADQRVESYYPMTWMAIGRWKA